MRSLEKIAKVGPENIMVMDFINNELVGNNKTYVIDESLIDRINFIKSGSFNENDGEPTLKLIGDVMKSGQVSVSKNIPIGIDFDSLIISFLSQKSMSIDEAKAYLNESFSQTSVYVPMYYFIKMSELGVDEVFSVIEKSRFLTKHHISNIERRLQNAGNIVDFDFDIDSEDIDLPTDLNKIPDYIKSLKSTKLCKKAIILVFMKYPEIIVEDIDSFDTSRLLQAISELQINTIDTIKNEVFIILLEIYMNDYQSFNSADKSHFRKAIARIDDVLYGI